MVPELVSSMYIVQCIEACSAGDTRNPLSLSVLAPHWPWTVHCPRAKMCGVEADGPGQAWHGHQPPRPGLLSALSDKVGSSVDIHL